MAFVKKNNVPLTIFCAREFYFNPASRMHKNVIPNQPALQSAERRVNSL